MTFDVSVYLPAHASNEKITLVIQKLLGDTFFLDEQGLLKNKNNKIKTEILFDFQFLTDMSFFKIKTHDALNNEYLFYLHTDLQGTKDHISIEHYSKKLSMSMNAFDLGIGKSLIDFFGGKITMTSDIELEQELNKKDNIYDPKIGIYYVKNGKFKATNKNLHQFSPNKQYEDFSNKIIQEPILSFENVEFFLNQKKFNVVFNEKQEKALVFLHKNKLKTNLEETLFNKNKEAKKIKV